MKKKAVASMILGLFLVAAGCATSVDADLEEARFAVDRGNWDTAIASAEKALTAEPSNVEAALLLSSAYAGRAGVRILRITADIADSTNSGNEFDAVHDALFANITSLGDLRSAIVALATTLTQPDATNDRYKDQQFQLGMLRAIEAFALPSLTAQPTESGTVTSTNITATQKDDIQGDLLDGDNNLIDSGMDATDGLVTNLRKNYCVLKNASTSATGFDLAALRDLNLCELTPDSERSSLTSANGSFQSTTITSCDDFNFGACDGAGNSTP